jgi:outer membrane cobalamin receptor
MASTLLGGLAAFAAASQASAAAAAAAGGEVSEIVVTGTRIPSPNLTSVAPVTSLGAATSRPRA